MAKFESASPVDPPFEDFCGVCDRPIRTRDDAWTRMASEEAIAVCAPICRDEACVDYVHAFPDEVAFRLRERLELARARATGGAASA